jgi:hypothetical protein
MVSALKILEDKQIPTLENALYYAGLAPVYILFSKNWYVPSKELIFCQLKNQ